MIRRFLRHLLARVRRDRLDDELREEMGLHVELRTTELVERGVPPAEAHAAALRRFGNATLLREDTRTMWGFGALDTWVHDVRYGVRMMSRTRALTAVVVVSLAIGIGANTAIFSVAHDVVLRKLPVPAPDELVLLGWVSSTKTLPGGLWGRLGDSSTGGYQSTSFVYPAYEAFRERTDLFTDLFAFKPFPARANVIVDGVAELVSGQVVSGNYYRGLGVAPAIGRAITDDDDRPESEAVVVLSYGYWQRRFGGDAAVLGTTITVNGVPATVVGVAPQGFAGTLDAGRAPEITMALAQLARLTPDAGRLIAQNRWWIDMMGRRAPGVTRDRIESALAPAFARVVGTLPKGNPEVMRVLAYPGARGLRAGRAELAGQLSLMAMVAALVLLIACGNVASLLMSRATARRREMAVRVAIGAGRRRLVRQLLTESMLLAGLGAAAGVVLARWLGGTLLGAMDLARTNTARLDWPVLGFTVALALACGLVFGLVPALRGTRSDLTGPLKEKTLGAMGSRPRTRLAAGLLVAQMALAVLLSVGAGLLLRTLVNLGRVDVGFDPARLLVFEIDPTLAGYEGDRLTAFYAQLLDRLRGVPGVEAAALSQHGLIAGSVSLTEIVVPGLEWNVADPFGFSAKVPLAFVQVVDPTFFDTIRLPLRLGRGFSGADRIGAPLVVVVNEALARLYFPGRSPIGGRFVVGSEDRAPEVEIVGVVADMPFDSLRRGRLPTFYVSYRQSLGFGPVTNLGAATLEIRTRTQPFELVPAARAAVRDLEPRLPLDGVRTEQQQIAESYREERLYATLAATLGAVGVLLAAIGLYGLLAYQVAQRTPELGVRVALGATRGGLARLVIGQSVRLAAAGAVLGVGASLAGTRVLSSVLFGLTATDPVTVAGAVALLLAVAVAAAGLPALRASRVDPLVALRLE